MSQSSLWLYPLVMMSVFALVLYARMGLRWTWPFAVQALAILFVALSGFVLSAHTWLFALIGWGLFGLFVVVPRTIVARMEQSLNLLRPDQALKLSALLKLFFWGDAGRFWGDMAQSMRLFLVGKQADAEEIIGRWRAKKLPRSTRDGLEGFHLTGLSLLRDWDAIIAEYRRMKESGGDIPYGIYMSACRAYLELGLVGEAEGCLARSGVGELRLSAETLDLVFLPFFALSGAEEDLDTIIAELSGSRSALPSYAVLCWRGRCLAARGRFAEARRVLGEALSQTTPEMSAWRERITYQRDLLKERTDFEERPDWSGPAARARELYLRARLVC